MPLGERCRRAGAIVVAFVAILALSLSGCALSPDAAPGPGGSAAATEPAGPDRPATPADSTAEETPPPPDAEAEPLSEPVTLTLWLPPEMAVDATSDDGTMRMLHAEFQEEHAGVTLDVVPKAEEGAGSLSRLLVSAYPIAPNQLPDLALVNAADLDLLADLGVVKPLDTLFSAPLWDQLYPFALEAGQVGEERYGVPYSADIEHLVYNHTMVSSPPSRWADLPVNGSGYLIPLGTGAGDTADTLLLQYLALGGSLSRDEGGVALDSALLAQVLAAYQEALSRGAIAEDARQISTLRDGWSVYFTGEVGLANADSRFVRRQRAVMQRTRLAPAPTINGEQVTLARSWAWVIVTPDPTRQALAAAYVQAVMQPEQMAAWCAVSHHLPTAPAALSLLISDGGERAFYTSQLEEAARPYPADDVYPEVQSALIQAVASVLNGSRTPEQAAVNAAAVVNRLR